MKKIIIDENADDVSKEAENGLPENAVLNEDGTVTLPLMEPVTLHFKQGTTEREEVITEVTFRRIKGADLEAIDRIASDFQQTKTLFARLTGKPAAIFSLLDALDIEGANAVMKNFTVRGQPTGKKS